MKYLIKKENIVFDNYFQIKQAKIEYESFEGSTIESTQFAFERGDSVAVLLYNPDTKEFLFTNQFRYPTCKHDQGWIIEIAAGSLEENENPKTCAKREVLEELGFEIDSLQHIHTFYTSPGGCTERMFLYYAEVSNDNRVSKGGGLKKENEDIQLVSVSKNRIADFLTKLEDAKTIIALQWFLLNK